MSTRAFSSRDNAALIHAVITHARQVVDRPMPSSRVPMKILITGPEGQVGWELMRAISRDHEILPASRERMDLAAVESIRTAVRELRPHLIVSAAAYTAVDQAEDEPEIARAVNATAVHVLAEEAGRIGAAVLHYSTDYVFDGRKTSPYKPDDPPNPLNVYGRTKLEGEQALLGSGVPAIILRTSWVYGLRRKNFLLTILQQSRTKPELRIVNDQIGCPTWCRFIAKSTAAIIDRVARCEDGQWGFSGKEGVYHLAAAGATTWFEFARRALELAAVEPTPKLVPVTSAEFAARAVRPAYSVLDCTQTADTFDLPIAPWEEMLEEVLASQAISSALAETTP
jgi:dTDP-4-dehydrorhamnose reductase